MTTRYDQGQKTRRKVLGDAHVNRSTADPGAGDAPVFDMITESAWAHVRSRDTISLRERSMVTLASPAPTTPLRSPRKSMRKWRVQLTDQNRLIPHNCALHPVPYGHNRFDIRLQDNGETIFLDM